MLAEQEWQHFVKRFPNNYSDISKEEDGLGAVSEPLLTASGVAFFSPLLICLRLILTWLL